MLDLQGIEGVSIANSAFLLFLICFIVSGVFLAVPNGYHYWKDSEEDSEENRKKASDSLVAFIVGMSFLFLGISGTGFVL